MVQIPYLAEHVQGQVSDVCDTLAGRFTEPAGWEARYCNIRVSNRICLVTFGLLWELCTDTCAIRFLVSRFIIINLNIHYVIGQLDSWSCEFHIILSNPLSQTLGDMVKC